MTDRIIAALNKLTAPTTTDEYAHRLQLPCDNLMLAVKGVGPLRFPVSATRARQLIKQAKPAPYGLKEKTLTDVSVRNTWEIAKSRVVIDKRAWNLSLQPALDDIRQALGLPDGKIKAELHKLLIYEKGQFFLPHKDTEKTTDMLATLVVVLPSAHKGGSLIINHQGSSKRFTIRNAAARRLNLFAFYADCLHEIKPITEGYRVALTYNLSFTPANPSEDDVFEWDTTELQQAMQGFFDGEDVTEKPDWWRHPEKLVYLLDHQYTPGGFTHFRLKGVDKLRTDALFQAAKSLDMHVNLALVELTELWSAYDESTGNYDYYDNRYFHGDDDEDEASDSANAYDDSSNQYDLQELIECNVLIDNWIGFGSEKPNYMPVTAFDSEMCWSTPSDHFEPFEEDYEGYMGNYGNTLDRRYHRAAVVLWPERMHLRVLLDMGEAVLIKELQRIARVDSAAVAKKAMQATMDRWPKQAHLVDSGLLGNTIELLLLFRNRDLSLQVLQAFRMSALRTKQLNALITLGAVHGKAFCRNLIDQWINAEDNRYDGSDWMKQAPSLCRQIIQSNEKSWLGLPEHILRKQLGAVTKDHLSSFEHLSPSDRARKSKPQVQQLIALLKTCRVVDNTKSTAAVFTYLMKQHAIYLDVTYLKLLDNYSGNKSDSWQATRFDALRDLIAQRIEDRLSLPPRTRDDWRIDASLECSCKDCAILSSFLASRSDKALDLPLAKARRMHLHRMIDHRELSVSHTTRRQGSPYVLQLRKSPSIFKLAGLQRRKDQQLLRNLKRLRFPR